MLSDETRQKKKWRKRPAWIRKSLHLIRRSHLYFGLLLVPWALLYGISAYLFNHPTHFSSLNLERFGREVIAGTPFESHDKAIVSAKKVVSELNQRFPDQNIELVASTTPRFENEFIFGSLSNSDASYRFLVHVDGHGVSISKNQPNGNNQSRSRSPFDVSPAQPALSNEPAKGNNESSSEPLKIDSSIVELCNDALPAILTKTGHWKSASQFKITGVPELLMLVKSRDGLWRVKHNALTGVVRSSTIEPNAADDYSLRQYLLNLHTAHGYPMQVNARWGWAIVVDVMSFVMVFWGISGLLMWWQIKATRPAGTVALVVSLLGAVWLGYAMYVLIRPG